VRRRAPFFAQAIDLTLRADLRAATYMLHPSHVRRRAIFRYRRRAPLGRAKRCASMKGSQLFRITSALLAISLAGASARATVVERVVAVVGERPILLSELKRRAAPFAKTLPGGSQMMAQATSRLYSDMLNRMIDEELIQRSASQSQLKVTDAEVDSAVERVAKGNNVSVSELMQELERSGVSATDYRRELRTQLLDAKVMNIRLQGRTQATEQDLHAEYERLTQAERHELQVRLVVIRLERAADKSARSKANDLIKQARAGADFGLLSAQNSADPATRDAKGELAPVRPSELPHEIAQAAVSMNPGDVSPPIESGGQLVIIKLLERAPSSIPPFTAVVNQLDQRVQMHKMENARRTWLDSLRKTTHVEIRL
jgi:peptidyl-prolyl cis-trans isomerase SurA